jgi:NADH:ubiquinone oxidoreductase subunit E
LKLKTVKELEDLRTSLSGSRPAGGGETTADGEISLETVNCLGACALGPITALKARRILKETDRK